MQIDDFKTWHWVAVGLLAGLAFSCVLALAGPPFANDELDTVDTSTFEYALSGRLVKVGEQQLAVRFHRGQPLLRDVVVHLPPRGTDPHKDWVTGQIYDVRVRPKNPTDPKSPRAYAEQWRPFKYPAPVPYPGQVGAQGTFPTVTGYLAAVQQQQQRQGRPFTYRVAWQETPAAIWSLPPVAGLLAIGVAWPLSLGILRSAGMAKPVKARAEPEPVPPPRPLPAVTGVRVVAPVVAPPPPVSVGDERQYGGEFYPVVKAAQHE